MVTGGVTPSSISHCVWIGGSLLHHSRSNLLYFECSVFPAFIAKCFSSFLTDQKDFPMMADYYGRRVVGWEFLVLYFYPKFSLQTFYCHQQINSAPCLSLAVLHHAVTSSFPMNSDSLPLPAWPSLLPKKESMHRVLALKSSSSCSGTCLICLTKAMVDN